MDPRPGRYGPITTSGGRRRRGRAALLCGPAGPPGRRGPTWREAGRAAMGSLGWESGAGEAGAGAARRAVAAPGLSHAAGDSEEAAGPEEGMSSIDGSKEPSTAAGLTRRLPCGPARQTAWPCLDWTDWRPGYRSRPVALADTRSGDLWGRTCPCKSPLAPAPPAPTSTPVLS